MGDQAFQGSKVTPPKKKTGFGPPFFKKGPSKQKQLYLPPGAPNFQRAQDHPSKTGKATGFEPSLIEKSPFLTHRVQGPAKVFKQC